MEGKMKFRILKLSCFCLSLVVFFSFSLNTYAADDILNKKDKYNCDEKIYSTATIDQNFEDDSVLVVLDKSISEINKTHELSLFNMPNTCRQGV